MALVTMIIIDDDKGGAEFKMFSNPSFGPEDDIKSLSAAQKFALETLMLVRHHAEKTKDGTKPKN